MDPLGMFPLLRYKFFPRRLPLFGIGEAGKSGQMQVGKTYHSNV